jgi:hypothetical protein
MVYCIYDDEEMAMDSPGDCAGDYF